VLLQQSLMVSVRLGGKPGRICNCGRRSPTVSASRWPAERSPILERINRARQCLWVEGSTSREPGSAVPAKGHHVELYHKPTDGDVELFA